MKTILNSLVSLVVLSAVACTDPDAIDKGVVQGRVTDSQGKPVANAEIVASNTDYYNKTSTGYTDANGNYRFNLPTGIAEGSYTVSGTVTMKFQGRNYKMALYTENSRVFSAYEGAVRNFQFRLTGKRAADADEDPQRDTPLGGTVEVHHDVNNLERENIELTFEPVGTLIDGSTGKKLVKTMPADSYRLYDIPLGQYKITARDKASGKPLGVLIKDKTNTYTSSVTALFEDSDFAGSMLFEMILVIAPLK
nr:carboxypeptidase-like regulatory domain-containing protein [uncultured Arsenicibacter sp.]